MFLKGVFLHHARCLPLPARHTFGFYAVPAKCENHTVLINGWPDGSSGRCGLVQPRQPLGATRDCL